MRSEIQPRKRAILFLIRTASWWHLAHFQTWEPWQMTSPFLGRADDNIAHYHPSEKPHRSGKNIQAHSQTHLHVHTYVLIPILTLAYMHSDMLMLRRAHIHNIPLELTHAFTLQTHIHTVDTHVHTHLGMLLLTSTHAHRTAITYFCFPSLNIIYTCSLFIFPTPPHPPLPTSVSA